MMHNTDPQVSKPTLVSRIMDYARAHTPDVSAETLGWLAVILIHAATLPSLMAMLTGLSDSVPSLDLVFLVWTGLMLMFARAVLLKDFLNIVTIALGFMIQALLLGLILFK